MPPPRPIPQLSNLDIILICTHPPPSLIEHSNQQSCRSASAMMYMSNHTYLLPPSLTEINQIAIMPVSYHGKPPSY